jgi:hypothetical protein
MAPNDTVENEVTSVVDAVPARGETGVIKHVDEMAYIQDINHEDIALVESDAKLVIEDAPVGDFEFNYNMNEDMFNSIWNMTLNKGDDTLKRILANKIIATYAKEHLTHAVDMGTVSKTTLGKAKKFKNQFTLSYGEDTVSLEDITKLLVEYRVTKDLPPIITKIIQETVYKEDVK